MGEEKREKFRKIKVGTGITQGDAFILGDVVDEESRQAHKELLERQQRNSGLLSDRAKRAAAELNGGTLPPPGTKKWDDPTVSPEEWYARQIVSKADDMLTFLDMANHTMGAKLTEKDIHAVLVAAYGLGRLTKEAEMKFKWEPRTLSALKQLEGASLGGQLRPREIKKSTVRILELYDGGNHTQGQIARILGMTTGAVKAAIRRHRK